MAVNSKVMKLSSRLISICKSSSKLLDTYQILFPARREESLFRWLEAAIKSELPVADVIPYLGYDKFLEEICRCDMALAAFPFGNTNSTVDTITWTAHRRDVRC